MDMIQINFVWLLNFLEISFSCTSKLWAVEKKVDFIFYLSLLTKFVDLFFSLRIVPLGSARSKFMRRQSNICHSLSVLEFFKISFSLFIFYSVDVTMKISLNVNVCICYFFWYNLFTFIISFTDFFSSGLNTRFRIKRGHYAFQQRFSVVFASWTLDPSKETVNCNIKYTKNKFADWYSCLQQLHLDEINNFQNLLFLP